MAAYATVDELEVWLSQTAPDAEAELVATRMLLRASELIDDYTRSATYEVDDDGVPTDADDIAAFRDATCAQVEFWFSGDEEEDILGALESLSIGDVTAKPALALELAPRAKRILRNAGLYNTEPVVQ